MMNGKEEIKMGNIIEVVHVIKDFGKFRALNDISINIEEGKIYGVVGRNGSGKTVLFKCIAGLLRPTEGVIRVNGKVIGKEIESPESLGMIIENPGFLPNYSAYHNLKFLAMIKNEIGKKRILESIELVGLDAHSKKKVGKYSMGMRQRLGIAQAIMEDPELLIFDEPMNGLDNHGVEDMRKLFLELKQKGKTIVLASHNREDIEVLCDTIVEMDRGNVISVKMNDKG